MKITIPNLDTVVGQIEAYRKALPNKLEKLIDRLAMIGAQEARVNFSKAMYAGNNDVEITVEPVSQTCYRVVAAGESVMFIEFGTGVLNPEHPQSAEFGFQHGTYGQGKGANENGWVYVGVQGNAGQPVRDGVYRTRGNPPARAMYDSAKDMRSEILRIAKEVFRN